METAINTTVLVTKPNSKAPQRAIALSSSHIRNKPRRRSKHTSKPRKESNFGTKSYNDSLQRAFNRAKQQIFFNPDMKYLVTLTYATNQQSIDLALYDVKQFIRSERRNGNTELKYLFIMEYQKRGAIHIHMITNSQLTTYKNKNGYLSLKHWDKHGFSSYLPISDLDDNFKPYLYLFKYMRKSQRIGKSFVHTSRNLNNFTLLDDLEFDRNLHTTKFIEEYSVIIPSTQDILHYRKEYMEFVPKVPIYDIFKEPTLNQKWNQELWIKTQLPSIKVLQRKQVKNIQLF